MKWALVAAVAALACLTPAPLAAQETVELDTYKSKTPANWKKEEPGNKFRAYQFEVPGTKGPAEVVIFHFPGGGSVKENVKRWQSQFAPPEGKTIEEATKITEMEVAKVPVTYVELSGTYLVKNPPFAPNAKIERKANYRMIGVVFESQNGPYFIRFVGPAETIAANKEAFDGWLKGFK